MQDHFGAERHKLSRCLREPHVVADRYAETADVRDVEDREFAARSDVSFIGTKREHLAVARDDRAVRIDDRRRVVDAIVAALEDRAGNEPHAMTRRHFAEGGLCGAGHRLRVLRHRTERTQLAEDDHLHPGKAQHQHIESLGHRGKLLIERCLPQGGQKSGLQGER